jgi:hypothetical protein
MKYPLPLFLQGRYAIDLYRQWLLIKAKSLRLRDLKLARPYAHKGTWDDTKSHDPAMRKGHLNATDFVALCKSVVDYRDGS